MLWIGFQNFWIMKYQYIMFQAVSYTHLGTDSSEYGLSDDCNFNIDCVFDCNVAIYSKRTDSSNQAYAGNDDTNEGWGIYVENSG